MTVAPLVLAAALPPSPPEPPPTLNPESEIIWVGEVAGMVDVVLRSMLPVVEVMVNCPGCHPASAIASPATGSAVAIQQSRTAAAPGAAVTAKPDAHDGTTTPAQDYRGGAH